jgi:TPR repeat protein
MTDPSKQESAIIVTKAYDLTLWLLPKVERFPHSDRMSVGDRLVSSGLDLLTSLVQASYALNKVELLQCASLQAAAWYRKAAEQGLANGQNHLGFMYDKGKGVPRNSVNAYMWWNLAAAGGSKKAERERDRLGSSMAAGDVAKAQQLSSERIPK